MKRLVRFVCASVAFTMTVYFVGSMVVVDPAAARVYQDQGEPPPEPTPEDEFCAQVPELCWCVQPLAVEEQLDAHDLEVLGEELQSQN